MARACQNCGKDISHKRSDAKSCGDAKCQRALQRRPARLTAAARDSAGALEAVQHETLEARRTTVVQREVQREVRSLVGPVVREALTEDVMVAMADLIKLTPAAVATLRDHMDPSDPEDYDAVLAQKAATTVMRYTVGHSALVTPEAATAPQIVVNFDLPRPTDLDFDAPATDEEDAVYLFECDVCHEELPVAERVAGADRCVDCHNKRKAAVLEQYGLLDA
jgi:hypothetical protein